MKGKNMSKITISIANLGRGLFSAVRKAGGNAVKIANASASDKGKEADLAKTLEGLSAQGRVDTTVRRCQLLNHEDAESLKEALRKAQKICEQSSQQGKADKIIAAENRRAERIYDDFTSRRPFDRWENSEL